MCGNVTKTRVRLVCCQCGSENIVADAFAAWNVERQTWELSATLDNETCNDCGADQGNRGADRIEA